MANKRARNAAAKPSKPVPNGSTPADLDQAKTTPMNSPTSPSAPFEQPPAETVPTQSEPEPEAEEDPVKKAEKVKEAGNVAFKAGRYGEALDLYSEAIKLDPAEPSYLTNRAAAHMGLKRFRPALEDCQQAATLQQASPQPKTLLRLARCQLALGSTTAATSTIKDILAIDSSSTPALQLREKIKALEGHVNNFQNARAKKEWGLARLALDKCLQAIEGEGGEVPTEWRIWRVELELARGNWENANTAAYDALRTNSNSPDVLALRGLVLFLNGKMEQAKTHATNALRLDPSCEQAMKLRKRVRDVERLKEEGNTAFRASQISEAVAKYTEALERIGESEEEGRGGQIRATLLSNRATALLKLSKHEEALKDTTTSLDLSPNSFKALRTRARIYLHLEKFDSCIADFRSAIQQADNEGSATPADVRGLRAELKKAEAALKRSKSKDYYKILGVARDCGDMDIKKAYRRESLKHHPDKGGDEEKFKLVVEAHAVLSDPQRRARYDMGEDEDGMNGGAGGGGFPAGFGGGGFAQHVDLTDLFGQFHSGGMAGSGFGTRGFNSFAGGPPGTGAGAGSSRRGFHSHAHSQSHSHSGGFPYFE